MREPSKRHILLILPEQLLELADDAAHALQLSRLAFIRQSIMRNVAAFQHNEKPRATAP